MEDKFAALEARFGELESKYNDLIEKQKAKEAGSDKTKPEEKKESGPHSRVKIIIQKINPVTGEPTEHQADSEAKSKDADEGTSIILRKVLNDRFGNGSGVSSEIDIKNPDLWGLLLKHLGHYPYHIFRGPAITLVAPFEPLIFNWDSLRKEQNEPSVGDKDDLAHQDLKLLLDLVSSSGSGDERLGKYFQLRDTYTAQKSVQFEDLWTVFPPGALIYGRPFQDQPQVFIVQDNLQTWPRRDDKGQSRPWKLDAWTYDWTGRKSERTAYTISIDPFDGYRPFTTLPYCPLDARPEQESIKEELIERGKRLQKLCTAVEGERLFEYSGKTIFGQEGLSGMLQDEEEDTSSRSRASRSQSELIDLVVFRRSQKSRATNVPMKSTHVDSRVMVDYESYFQYGPPFANNGSLPRNPDNQECMCNDCQSNDGLMRNNRTRFDKVERQKEKEWEEEQYLLCPPRVLGYLLDSKQWAQLQVTLLKDIPLEDPSDAWSSRLQLDDDDTKPLLLNLVKSHVSNSKKQAQRGLEVDDIIPRKGKGLVVLLYGPPGVGKTSTAEIIAVAARKPLFSISVADVGTKAKHVEANLAKIFALATSWQAILLIDEADVFLETRGKNMASTEKNALVSVFLRVLEYYQGIMFLTTNQIAQFDVAIPSRIHIAIKYETLSRVQMDKIFRGFLEPLEERGLVEDYAGIMQYLKEDVYSNANKFDGRQIRNAVTTALGLARAESEHGKGKLRQTHLKKVINNANTFKSDFSVQFDRYKSSQNDMIK
ncbi:aaa family atpase [Apiospora phragmitis]|uniref:Aaa family atpase n=1 Tax=Apiospora phragmitis TaxID=2905665 RepID=A0ABR1VS44_9PEZI